MISSLSILNIWWRGGLTAQDQPITLTLNDTKVTAENDPTVCDLSKTVTTDVVQRKSQLLKPHIPPFKILGTKSPYKMGSSIKGSGFLSPWGEDLHFGQFVPNPNIRLSKDIVFSMQEMMCRFCGNLAQFQAQNTNEPISECPWQFIRQDLVLHLSRTPIFSQRFTMRQTQETHLARHGVPKSILNDNGPQFVSYPALQKIPD